MKKDLLAVAILFLCIPTRARGAEDNTGLSLPAVTAGPGGISTSAPAKPAASDSTDVVLEQGKTLFDNGQYVAALDKFMRVLRHDPRNPEAREYLKMVVDQMRAQKQTTHPRPMGAATAPRELNGDDILATPPAPSAVPVAMTDDDARQKVRQRQLLSLDLGVIPGVKVVSDGLQTRVEIETALLFKDKTGGLREEGIPILDRVSAWLKTFGQQPVFIHCYPEEFQDAATGGSSLFLHRYAQLYGFFIDERKMPATRFINTESVKPEEVAISTTTSLIIIGSLGGAPLNDDSAARAPRWLEFSVMSSRTSFNPEDGDWASIDLAALARKGLKTWNFRIIDSNSRAVLSLQGKGNLLKRISWDGRDEKTGGFMAPGSYLCRLQATDTEGSSMTHDMTLQIQRPGAAAAPVVARKPKKTTHSSDNKPTSTKRTASPSAGVTKGPVSEYVPRLPPPAQVAPPIPAAVSEPAMESPEVADASAESADSSSAIWKQVIQFDLNESDLKPTLKASLERIGKTLEVYPLQKVRITGFADSTEQNAPTLAKQRAAIVRDTLVNEYQVSAKRVINAGGKTGAASGGVTMMKVEISITN